MSQISWLWTYLKGNRARLTAGFFLSAITSGMIILNPMLSQRLIDDVITPGNTKPLIPLLATMLVIQVTRLSLRYIMHNFCFEFESNIAMTILRHDMFKMVQGQDFRFLGKFPTGNLMTRMTQDLDRVRHTVAWVTFMFVDSVVLFAAAFTFLLFVNWQLALCLTSITPFILWISHRFMKIIRPRFVLLREKLTDLGTVVTENIDGNRVVKAFAREDHEIRKFEVHNAEFRDVSCENAIIAARYNPALEGLSQLLLVITLVVGGIFLIRGQLTAGQYLSFSSLTWALAGPLRMMAALLADIERYNATATMLKEVVEAPQGYHDSPDSLELKERPAGGIEFKDVNLIINGNSILKDVSFKACPGDTIGILGSTGSGKTSLINLLTHFYEPTSGEVLLDGVDVRKYTLSSLRRNIGLAMQDVFLFSDAVKGNIAYGRPELDEESIVRRAVQADADHFIRQMEKGYETLVGERGTGLSGGQKQRIALARALAISPAILILDDTTSAVDSETEQYIQDQLRNLDFPCTKIIIAQRISSFRGANQILVMDKGRIVERGRHEELLKNKGFYHYIWSLQYNAGTEAGWNREAGGANNEA
ncbi:ABC transporter ATP-binding protein [Leadbettera azotonutricia]|uniref:ABC transporter, ATP-binding/permease protein n=1 Tax=Leadbettera azotonutricia (strain ATCC BAA-888 / DSM 13862 / ZAS-9) TaxID=545695 RepID=F5YEI8_LEAAZ|nr:ABC transporter ATP-binding protein [Leadbettera azotonutricia]AEF82218.1 ABC transporter, ATP-binding/permease protein [Leadbettera azotonutricia ZAS-9]